MKERKEKINERKRNDGSLGHGLGSPEGDSETTLQ